MYVLRNDDHNRFKSIHFLKCIKCYKFEFLILGDFSYAQIFEDMLKYLNSACSVLLRSVLLRLFFCHRFFSFPFLGEKGGGVVFFFFWCRIFFSRTLDSHFLFWFFIEDDYTSAFL